ncbi:MAG: GGDEF domain-containing protein [Betaproteobacteria bacterium]|nr:MAG: GGDEF domain-containing protein [Betaproteobacteria bacterium]
MPEFLRLTRPIWPAAAILAVTAAAVWLAPPLPASLAGLSTAGPYAVLVTAVGLAWWYNRGRTLVVAVSILLGWSLYAHDSQKLVYTVLVILVPLNCLAVLLARERGARYGPAYRWLGLIALEGLAVLWLDSAGKGYAESLLGHWSLRSPPTPLAGRLAFAAAFAAAAWRSYPEHRPLQVAKMGAIAAFFIGSEWGQEPAVFAAFMTAAGAILIVAMLQESHQLAFHDELTGLPGRRALDERLRALGSRYALAMIDVDHFKKFNDTHGHDIGDQVLKLVAGRLAQVGGGGIAYRYGGEEFSVLFPDSGRDAAMVHLTELRRSIESYRMAVRGEDRPKDPQEAAKLRGTRTAQQTLSVTVSIGVADPSDERRTPAQVLKAADEALYRAKQAGRNRVSR